MKKVVAMVLAGGQGKRMEVLCQVRPKPALPFAGRFRVIDFTLSNCVHSGIGNVALLTDYQRDHMAAYLKQWSSNNPGDYGLDTLEPKEGSYRGTADAVYQNLDYLKRYGPEVVVVLAGDHIYSMDYRRMLAFHLESSADVTVGVMPVPLEEASRFGIVIPDGTGRIVDFNEKPAVPASNLASMGIYIFNPRVLTEGLAEDHDNPVSSHDFGYSLIPDLVKRRRAFAYKFEGYWRDIGTVETYYEANMELTSRLPSYTFNDAWPILTRDCATLPPTIAGKGRVKHSLIGSGCVIEGEVEGSILSPGVRVEENAVVRNSIVMERTVIGRNSLVDRCILDEGVTVGTQCCVGLESNPIRAGWGITVVGKCVRVPPWTDIGRNLRVFPGVGWAGTAAGVTDGVVV